MQLPASRPRPNRGFLRSGQAFSPACFSRNDVVSAPIGALWTSRRGMEAVRPLSLYPLVKEPNAAALDAVRTLPEQITPPCQEKSGTFSMAPARDVFRSGTETKRRVRTDTLLRVAFGDVTPSEAIDVCLWGAKPFFSTKQWLPWAREALIIVFHLLRFASPSFAPFHR